MSTINNRTNVTITATVDRTVSEYDVRTALGYLARDNNVALSNLSVQVAPAERTVSVEMTEAQFAAWQESNTSA